MGDIGHFVKFKNLLDDIGYLMQDEVFKKLFNKNVLNPHTNTNSLKVNLINFEIHFSFLSRIKHFQYRIFHCIP